MNASITKSQAAIKRWEKARNAYAYARKYLQQKKASDKSSLTVIDLILVSNFKGGSASICEPIQSLQGKLPKYSDQLKEITTTFEGQKLSTLSKESLEKLSEMGVLFLNLTKENKSKIDGFGPSNASALLNIYFPDLLPILDRRVLNGAKIKGVKINSQKQVVNIERHYKDYIIYCYQMLLQSSHNLESLDRELFSLDLSDLFKRKPKNK